MTFGAVGVAQVQRVERVDLAERHDVPAVAEEAHGVDPLALAEPGDAADRPQPPVAGRSTLTPLSLCAACGPRAERRSSVVATRSAPSCSDIENWLSTKPGTRARGAVGRLRLAADVERVQLGDAAGRVEADLAGALGSNRRLATTSVVGPA